MVRGKRVAWLVVGVCIGALGAFGQQEGAPKITVLAEEDVYTFVNPDNGSGPLWSYGCTSIARLKDTILVSEMETGEGVPPLANTRWRLLRRTKAGWERAAEAENYRQREPCSLATLSAQEAYMYVNDSTEPPGTKYGPCTPYLIKFALDNGNFAQTPLKPQWQGETYFTDHSYRGYAADRQNRQLLMLNIDAKTSIQHACLLSPEGETLANGSITFPIRACYPQVALRGGAVHVLAVGDIVEPVEAWRTYKHEQTQRDWDYVFRILYYASTPDLRKEDFGTPVEIANVDATAGHISNHDLWISPEGEAYILYGQREVASELMRDKFFPDKSTLDSLCLAVVKNGAVVERKTLVKGSPERTPGVARFHLTPDGTLYAVLYAGGTDAGNKLMQVYPRMEHAPLVSIPLTKALGSFSLATTRAGNAPSYTIDLLGQRENNTMAYAAVLLSP